MIDKKVAVGFKKGSPCLLQRTTWTERFCEFNANILNTELKKERLKKQKKTTTKPPDLELGTNLMPTKLENWEVKVDLKH